MCHKRALVPGPGFLPAMSRLDDLNTESVFEMAELGLSSNHYPPVRKAPFCVKATGPHAKIVVSAVGTGIVSRAGRVLLAQTLR